MNIKKYILTVFIATAFFGLAGCSNHSSEKSDINKITKGHLSMESQQANSVRKGNLNKQKDELTKIYSQAIEEFIKVSYKHNKTTFDTLYFGKHVNGQPEDFPNIELPEIIEEVQVRLVNPQQGEKLLSENVNRNYVNLIGFVESERAEFIFVVFSDGFTHEFDYYLNFINNLSINKFVLDKIDFESYLQGNRQKPKRITIYKDGKYVANK